MAIQFRDVTTGKSQAATSLTVAVPPLVQVNDILFELACTSTGRTITNPTTATALTGSPVTDGTELGYGWRKTAVSGDLSSNVALSMSVSEKICAAIAAWSGVDTASPIHQIASAGEAGTTVSHQMPSVTTTVAGCTIVFVIEAKDGTDGVTTLLTPPSGATLRASVLSGGTSQQVLGVAAMGNQPAGTYGGAGITFDSNAGGAGQANAVLWTIALKPAATTATQTSRPASVVTAGTFTASPTLTDTESLTDRIGEATRDDATYIQTPVNPSSQVFEWEETPALTDPGLGNRTGVVVDWVLSTAAGATSSTFVCEVRQAGNGTALASFTRTAVPSTPTYYADTMSDAQIGTIDWNLPLRKRVTITVT